MIIDDLRKVSENLIHCAYDFEEKPTAIGKAQIINLIEILEKIQIEYKSKIQNTKFGG